jgi:tetratricopeptide (TPR) repeat protein
MADDIRQTLEGILRLVADERLDDAESACASALDARPDDVSLVSMMGAIHLHKGALDSAEAHLRRAIEIEPGFAKPHEDLGALCLARNEAAAAVPHFRKALVLAPGQASAMRGLAAALQQAGQEHEADEVRLQFMQSLPSDKLLAEAEALLGGGRIPQAEQLCDVVLARDPEHTGALRVLAMAATGDERFVIAEGYLKRILRLAPGDARAHYDLAHFLNDRGRYQEAIELAEPAARQFPDNAPLQLLLANMLGIVGRTGQALQAYERCLSIDPDDPAALIGRGHMLRIAGRQDAAKASYERCVSVNPEIGSAWWYLASFHRHAASDDDVATMLAQLDKGGLSADAEVGFHFALARASEKREDYASAWAHYVAGNDAKRKLVRYDPVKSELEQRKIRARFSAELLSGTAATTATDVTPVFILGMPRSGSTLIEQILASHSRVEGTGELPYILMMTSSLVASKAGTLNYTELIDELDAAGLTRLGENYLGNAASHRVEGTPYFTDKMPANFPHAGFIRMILPHAKIIDARRDPLATCVANYRQLFAQGKNQSYNLVELGEYYLEYVKMMEHWDAVMPGAVLRVRYEDVVADLETQVRRVLDYCGLPFESACVEYHKSGRLVNTASAEQVREPIYRDAVSYWKNYEPYLDELREVLAPLL